MSLQWDRLYAQRVSHMRSSDIRDAFKLTEDPRIVSFAGGFPGPESFPVDEVVSWFQRLSKGEAARVLQYGPAEGATELRELIAQRMTSQGMPANADEILITNGSQQALDLFSKVFLNPGDRMATENPGYAGALNVFHAYQAEVLPVRLDEDGLVVSELEELLERLQRSGEPLPKFVYVVPNFQNPVGATLSLERRRQLLLLAQRFGFVILEDNPYGDLRYEGEPVPSIRALDGGEHTFYLGSFSKVFLPGLRVGWIKGPAAVIRRLSVAKGAVDLCGSTLSQWLVIQALREGLIDRRLQGLRQLYKQRRDAMLEALETFMPEGVSWNRPQGGFFVWLRLPEGFDAKALLPKAIAKAGVAYVAGSAFFDGPEGRRTIRLAFSQQEPEAIRVGIQRLAELVREEMDQSRNASPEHEVFVQHA